MVRQGKGDLAAKLAKEGHPEAVGVGNCNKITVLKKPKAKEAMEILTKVATLVHPIMKKHGWTLPLLSEFFPDNPNLLGVNVNGGQKICIRLRPANDPEYFYPLEEHIMGTMLHELTHNVHGPHDDKFYKFLDGLQDEYDELRRTGYSGQGFLSDGKKLSTERHDSNMLPSVARAKALAEAEKRRKLGLIMGPSGGQKLGGASSSRNAGKPLRQILAEATERRLRDNKQCVHGEDVDVQAEAIKAERDSLTIVDLTLSDSDEEDASKPGPSVKAKKPPLFAPAGDSDDGSSDGVEILAAPQPKASTSKLPRVPPKKPSGMKRKAVPLDNKAKRPAKQKEASTGWTCTACTFANPVIYLQCEVCTTVRPSLIATEANFSGPLATQNLSTDTSWFCHVCREENPHDRWSCAGCSNIKLSS